VRGFFAKKGKQSGRLCPDPLVADWCLAFARGSCDGERLGGPGVVAKEQGYAEIVGACCTTGPWNDGARRRRK